MPEERIRPPSRLRMYWPAFAVGLGLVATLLWLVFLGWLLGHAVRLTLWGPETAAEQPTQKD
jgi:hypothetical protein